MDAQTDPPASGDWTVSDTTVVEDRLVDLSGDLTVASGGNLTLRNVTLRVYSTTLPPYKGVYVLSGGRLVLTDRDGNASTTGDRTVVTRGVPSWPYLFSVEQGARFEARMSAISGAGIAGAVGGVEVRADDAVIDGMAISSGEEYSLGVFSCANVSVTGSTLALSDAAGFKALGAQNLTLRGCRIVQNQEDGVVIWSSRDVLLDDCNVSANGLTGVRVTLSSNVTLRGCLVMANSDGVQASSSNELLLASTTVIDPMFYGVRLVEGCDSVLLDTCTIRRAPREGVLADSVRNLTLVGCRVSECTYDGIEVQNNSREVNVTDCTIELNGYSGLKLENCRRVRVDGGRISGNGYHGVWFTNCQDIELADAALVANKYNGLYGDFTWDLVAERLNASRNEYSGVELAGNCHDWTLRECTLSNNSKSGIWLTLGKAVEIDRCRAEANEFYGIRAEGGSSDVLAVGCTVDLNEQSGLSVVRNCLNITFAEGSLDAVAPNPVAIVDTGAELRIINSSVDGRVQARGGGRCLVVSPRGGNIMPTAQDPGSYVDEGWWLSVEVVWPSGGAAPGATVNATSRGGARNTTAVTGADGWARYIAVVQSTETSTGFFDRNPWTVMATIGDTSNATSVSVRSDTTVRIILSDVEPPVARTTDIIAELGLPTGLNGSASTDNIAVRRWLWTFEDGLGTVLLEGPVVEWTFKRVGTFAGTLEVRDASGLSSVVDFTVTVKDTTAPVAHAPDDAVVPQGTTLDLDGRGSVDNDPQLLTTGRFDWTVTVAPSGALVTILSGPIKPWTFPDMGLYVVVLRVTDQSGNWGEDAFNVTVLDTTAPTVETAAAREVDEDVPVTFAPATLQDNDPDFPANGWVWWVMPLPGADIEVDGAEVVWTFSDPGTFTIWLHARDAAGNEASASLTVTVRDRTAPTPPRLEDLSVEMGSEVSLSAEGAVDNDPSFPQGSSYVWRVEGPRLLYERGGTAFAFTPPWVGTYNVTLEVIDASGNAATASLVVTSVDTMAPQFTSFAPGPSAVSPTRSVQLHAGLHDAGTGIDPARLEVRVRLAGAADWGPWKAVSLQVGGNDLVAGLTVALAEGVNIVQLRVWDLAGTGPTVSDEHAVRVNVAPVARILSPVDGASFSPYDDVVLDGSPSTDPDTEDSLEMLWYSDVDGLVGEGVRANASHLTPGPHRITLEVRDGITGHVSVAQVNITVDRPPSTGTGEVPSWVWLVAILLTGAAGLLLAREVWLRRSGRSGPPGPDGTASVGGTSPGEWEEDDVGIPPAGGPPGG